MKDKQKQLLTEVMNADAKDGLYDHIGDSNKKMSAVDWLLDNLHYMYSTKWEDIIEQAKQMEKEQKKLIVISTYVELKMKNHNLPYGMEYINKLAKVEQDAEQYYNEMYGKE